MKLAASAAIQCGAPAAEPPPSPVLIGPNAVTQLAAAIDRLHGPDVTRSIFTEAEQTHHLDHPPAVMVDEEDVISLHLAGRRVLGETAFMAVGGLAGSLTGDYLLRNRIPAAARALLPWLPDVIASRALARAIARHAWTFAGSGHFDYRPCREGLLFTIENSPLTRHVSSPAPCCDYYTATFERIFRALVSPRARVAEISCAASGGAACHFLVGARD